MWDILPKDEKELYKKSIQAYASLSEAFSQKNEDIDKLVPVINSKYQERQFCNCFNGTVEDIGNTSYDASLKKKINGKTYKFLVGIKTFRFDSSEQKIAQFKKNNKDWEYLKHTIKKIADEEKNNLKRFNERSNGTYKDLAIMIAELRNSRIDSAISNLRGFVVDENSLDIESVYHVLMPSNEGKALINVGEISYDKIDKDNIEIFEKKSLNHLFNFDFTDGKHIYKYTDSDSQLYMDFKNKDIITEQWNVKFRNNPSEDLIKLLETEDNNVPVQTVTESYNWKIKIERYSGFNMFYALSGKNNPAERKKKVKNFLEKIDGKYNPDFISKLSRRLNDFCEVGDNNKERKAHRESIREKTRMEAMSMLNEEDYKKLINLMYRPKNEFYIPIPDSRRFHEMHPNFFGEGNVTFEGNGRTLSGNPEDRTFNLIFEPSGNVIKSYVNQDRGKAIESNNMQSILGKWVLRDILQLDDYQPVTQETLDNMHINAMRLYKIKGEPSNNVHLEFTWVDEDE